MSGPTVVFSSNKIVRIFTIQGSCDLVVRMAAFSASKIALVLAVAQCLMSFIKADNFPLIYWHQALKPPLSVTNGFNAPSCADTEGSDGDVDCKINMQR